MVGAGAIINYLQGDLSPEAQLAAAAYRDVCHHLKHRLKECGSGRELINRGFTKDVDLAAEFNVSKCVPKLVNGAYTDCSK